ncbi:hypothetical protein ENBRE01_2833 [Enteropsectra breve]|nr:hypothetical protein ENBRE01_2833 [Enteropsectra breve]
MVVNTSMLNSRLNETFSESPQKTNIWRSVASNLIMSVLFLENLNEELYSGIKLKFSLIYSIFINMLIFTQIISTLPVNIFVKINYVESIIGLLGFSAFLIIACFITGNVHQRLDKDLIPGMGCITYLISFTYMPAVFFAAHRGWVSQHIIVLGFMVIASAFSYLNILKDTKMGNTQRFAQSILIIYTQFGVFYIFKHCAVMVYTKLNLSV